tara:strand:+ start:2603 stop:3919 length:1317 start_codon:yes stop_codon:yes gene_type:complete
MSKVVFFSTTFYPEMITWNPLGLPLDPEWKEFERDWKALGRPMSPLTGDPEWTKGMKVVTQKENFLLAKSKGVNRNPYAGDWRRVGELGENFLYAAGRLVHCPLPFDRTGNWNIFNTLYDPIPSTDNWNMDFPEVCHKRAQELWGMSDDIRLWWSGGIDSTTSLTALIQNQPKDSTLRVLLSKQSIEENPTYYEKIKKLGLPLEWSTKENMWDVSRFSDGTINVTGECGDPMYGTFVVEHHIEEINEPWKEMFNWSDCSNIYEIRDDRPLNKPLYPKFIDWCEEYIKLCPFEIKNTFDFTWWLAFTIKWQWIDRRLFGYLEPPTNWRNMISFFNSEDFQRWSIVNHDLKHKGTWKTYKWPSKEFIYEYNRDDNYLNNKTKETSFPKTVPVGLGQIRNKLIMDDGNYVKRTETVDYKEILCWDVFDKGTFTKLRDGLID